MICCLKYEFHNCFKERCDNYLDLYAKEGLPNFGQESTENPDGDEEDDLQGGSLSPDGPNKWWNLVLAEERSDWKI